MDTGRAAQEHPDPALDFFSEEFDAAKALTTPGLQPPMPDAPVLDYLAKCRTLLPPEMPESLANVAKEAGQKSGSEATRLKHEQLRDKAKAAIQRIEQGCQLSLAGVHSLVKPPSPLCCLQRWHEQGARVRVVTRHATGVRGVAEGELMAYDLYMNLVLRDVTERYTVLIKVAKPKTVMGKSSGPAASLGAPDQAQGSHPSALQHKGSQQQSTEHQEEAIRWVRKQEHRQRSLGQVFIKGDNVVCVCCPPAQPTLEAAAGLPQTDTG